MGMCTRYKLTWYNRNTTLVTNIPDYITEFHGDELESNGDSKGPRKWYGHKEDLKTMSEVFTGVLFHLQCDGEDNQYWDVFAENGKIQSHKAKIVRTTTPNPKKWR